MLPFLRVGCRGDSGWLSILPGRPQRGGPSGDSQALPLRVTGEDLDVSISFRGHTLTRQLWMGAPAMQLCFLSSTHFIYFERLLGSAFEKYKGAYSRQCLTHSSLPGATYYPFPMSLFTKTFLSTNKHEDQYFCSFTWSPNNERGWSVCCCVRAHECVQASMLPRGQPQVFPCLGWEGDGFSHWAWNSLIGLG